MDVVTIFLALFFAFLTFGLTGFGSGLIGMALLTPLLGLATAAPMFAAVSIFAECLTFLRYREHIQLQSVWRLAIASLIAIPIGIAIIPHLNEHLVLILLGLLLISYGAYSLFRPNLPLLTNRRWGFGFGFVSGLLTGAYNSGGPPLVIYGNLARWSREEFKCNLPGLFMLNSAVVITVHLLAGHYSQAVLQNVLIGIPAMLIGLVVGWSLDKRINPEDFRKIVLFLLVVIGVRLIIGNL